MIIVTGGLGFIGSNIIKGLNKIGLKDITICDWLNKKDKKSYISNFEYNEIITPDKLFNFIKMINKIDIIIHMGAISSTTEKNFKLVYENNTAFSKKLWKLCVIKNIRLIYASSAATYGDGKKGFSDEETINYNPLNLYGWSKYFFDRYAIKNSLIQNKPPQWVGLKFFNVYGPNEYHKGVMQSVVKHSLDQYKIHSKVKLFKSYNNKYKDGEQTRDFIYVNDCVAIINWLINNPQINGIYNCGTGKGRTFVDLVNAMFKSIKTDPKIEFIEMPTNIKNQYQYYTEADMSKIRKAGYNIPFTSLEDGVYDYVTKYLLKPNIKK